MAETWPIDRPSRPMTPERRAKLRAHAESMLDIGPEDTLDMLDALDAAEAARHNERYADLLALREAEAENARLRERVAALPYTTPTGFTYEMPHDWPTLSNYVMNHLQGIVECWDDAECPPVPWTIPGIQRLMWNLLVRVSEENEYMQALAALEARDDD
jgi:hypothetical protein